MSCSVLIVQIFLIPKRWWVRKEFNYSVNSLVSSHPMSGACNLIRDNKTPLSHLILTHLILIVQSFPFPTLGARHPWSARILLCGLIIPMLQPLNFHHLTLKWIENYNRKDHYNCYILSIMSCHWNFG